MFSQKWLEGYVIDVPYPADFHYFLSPDFLNFCTLLYGVAPPSIKGKFNYLELGSGTGFCINAMAAFYPEGNFYGVDFNPQHIVLSKDIKEEAGLENITFIDKSFEELLSYVDYLPDFDYIVMHGVFAWISHENREILMKLVKKKLKPGGIVYIGYNNMCGWSFRVPFQRFLVDLARLFPDIGSLPKMNMGMRWIKRLEDVGSHYFNLPQVKKTTETLGKESKNYLVHEYLNTTWAPLFFTDVLSYARNAKLSYVGMAEPIWNFEKLIFNDEQLSLLNEVRSPFFKEMLKDYIVGLSFRKDIYVKGATYIASSIILDKLKDVKVVLLQKTEDKKYKIEVPFINRNVNISSALLDILFDILKDGPKSIGEILQDKSIKFNTMELISTLCLLIKGRLINVVDKIRDNKEKCIALNKSVARRSRHSNFFRYMCIPSACSAIFTNLVQRLVYDAVVGEEFSDVDSIISHVITYSNQNVLNLKEEDLEDFCRREVTRCIEEDIPIWEKLGML